jgi:serine/threonine protein kinase
MFALGCLLFECVAGRELFANSWAIQMYSHDPSMLQSNFDQFWPPRVFETRLSHLQELATELLAVEPTARPGAYETLRRLALIRSYINPKDTDQEEDEYFSVRDEVPVLDDGALIGLQEGWLSRLPPVPGATFTSTFRLVQLDRPTRRVY